MTHVDLTLSELLHDPMIHQVMKADRVSMSKFMCILQDAARRQHKTLMDFAADRKNNLGFKAPVPV